MEHIPAVTKPEERAPPPVKAMKDPSAMKFFGSEKWGAASIERAEIPVGRPCFHCEKPIAATDLGVFMPYMHETGTTEIAMHRRCLLEQIFGPEKAAEM